MHSHISTANKSQAYARLLLITHESVGEKMAGPGIRAWEIARALGEAGVQVSIATPSSTVRQSPNVTICNFEWERPETLRQLIDRHVVVMATGPVLSRVIRTLGGPVQKPVVVDTYYVPEIEEVMLALTSVKHEFDPTPAYIEEMFNYLRQGDYFLVALEKQYDFMLGALMAAGRLNKATMGVDYTADNLIGLVPLGLPKEPPQRGPNRIKGVVPGIGLEDKVIFWGGGIWDWMDPLSLMDALHIVLRERDDVRVMFGSLHHFSRNVVPEMSVAGRLLERIEREGWLGKHVFFLDWVPYDERGSLLLEADLGVSLSIETLESRYAIRARLLDYLWAGLPSVLTRGDDMAAALQQVGLADLLPPKDVDGLSRSILQRLGDESGRQQGIIQAAPLVVSLRWPNCVGPLLDFLSHPSLAPDAAQARGTFDAMLPLHQAWEELRHENIALKEEIQMLRQRKAVRIADAVGTRLNRWRGK